MAIEGIDKLRRDIKAMIKRRWSEPDAVRIAEELSQRMADYGESLRKTAEEARISELYKAAAASCDLHTRLREAWGKPTGKNRKSNAKTASETRTANPAIQETEHTTG